MDNIVDATNISIQREIDWLLAVQQLIREGLRKDGDPILTLAELLSATDYLRAKLENVLAS